MKISEKVREVVQELAQLGDEAQYHYLGSGAKPEKIATIEDIEQLLEHKNPYVRAAGLMALIQMVRSSSLAVMRVYQSGIRR